MLSHKPLPAPLPSLSLPPSSKADSVRLDASRANPGFSCRGATSTDASSRCGAIRSRPLEMGASGDDGRACSETASGPAGDVGLVSCSTHAFLSDCGRSISLLISLLTRALT